MLISNNLYRSIGIKIGKNTTIAPRVQFDYLHPELIEIGDNCLIGGKSFIFPGVTIEDDVSVALNSVVLKDQHLKKGKVYAGTPAKEIAKKGSENESPVFM